MRNLVLMIVFGIGSHPAGADESMRCGNALISSKDTVAELLAKCGEPNSIEERIEDVRARGLHGSYKVGVTKTEIWTYQKSTRTLPRIVTIVDGEIQSIETKTQ